MEPTEQVLKAIMSMVEELEIFKADYPSTPKALAAYCKGVCRIAQDQPDKKIDALPSLRILIDKAADDFKRFPAVAELYEMYRDDLHFRPADMGPVDMKKFAMEEKWRLEDEAHQAEEKAAWERSRKQAN